MKTLIVYYSQARGNTKRIAEMVQKATGADVAEIKTVVPYEGTYEEIVEQGKDEVNSRYMPEIMPVSIDGYDRIIIGSPTWWYTMAPAVKTFIESTDFTGKTVVPFITHGAKKDSYFSHIAVEVPGEETSTEWCDAVTDEEYGKLGGNENE